MAVTVAGFLVVVQASKDESYLPTSSSVLSSTSPSSTSPLVESSTAESTIRWLVTGPSPPDSDAQIGQGDNNIFSSEEPTTVPHDDVSGFNRFDVLFLGVLCCSMLLGACDYVYRCYFGPDEEKLKERREKQRRQDTIRFFQQRNARLVSFRGGVQRKVGPFVLEVSRWQVRFLIVSNYFFIEFCSN